MITLLARIINRLVIRANKRNAMKRIHFRTKEAKKNCVIGKNVSIYNPNVFLGDKVVICDGVVIWGQGTITIGDNVKIGFNTIIYSHENSHIVIGQNCAIAAYF